MKRLTCIALTACFFPLASACFVESDEDVGADESGLTRSETSYVVSSTLPFSTPAGSVHAIPWDGRVAVVTDGERGALDETFVLDGGALHQDSRAPRMVRVAAAYDPQRQISYEITMDSVAIITASSRIVKLVDRRYGQPIDKSDPSRMLAFVDPPTGTLYRLRDGDLEQMEDVSPAYAQHPSAGNTPIVRWRFVTGAGGTFQPPLVAFDEERRVLVAIRDSDVREYDLATSTWRQATVQIEGRDPGYLGHVWPCLLPVYDSKAKRMVAFCPGAGGGWFKEWDGKTLRFGQVERESWINTSMAFDRASGKFVVTDPGGVYLFERRQSLVTNAEPVLARAEQTVFATENSRLDFGVKDPDGDPVQVTFGVLPPGATIDGDALVWRPTPADAGEHTIEMQLDDGESVVSRQAKVTVDSLSYALPTGSYHQVIDFGARGKTSQGPTSRGASARVHCTLEGENPGVLHVSCGVTTEICSGGAQGGAWCTQTRAVGMSMQRVLNVSGPSTGSETSCTGPGCGNKTFEVTATVTDRDRICVTYGYHDWIEASSVAGEGCNR